MAHTFCPLIHPAVLLDVPSPSPIDSVPSLKPPPIHRQSPTSDANSFIQLTPLCFFSVLSSGIPQPPSSHEMSLQSTLVKTTLNSPQFARFHPSSTVATCRFVSTANILSTMRLPNTSLSRLDISEIHATSPLSFVRTQSTVCGKHASPSKHE